MRALALVVTFLLAGCTGAPEAGPAPAPTPEPPAPEEPALRMVALDGRWSFPEARAAQRLAEVGAPAPVGALVFAEARASRGVADVVALDARAAAALEAATPRAGEAFVSAEHAARDGLGEGDALVLSAEAWPVPYVATYFEMERTGTCERRPEAKLCFLPELEPGTARLRLRAGEGARDAGFLPDLVELGPQGRPAWWNGTFESPSGAKAAFSAHASAEGALTRAEFDGPMEAGDWTVSFRLEANGRLAPSGAAGIVRIREPGYLWFDDRFQEIADPLAQARAVLANATPTRVEARVARIVPELPAGADVQLAHDDARVIAGAAGPTALLVPLTPSQERALAADPPADGLGAALRARPLPEGGAPARGGGALVLAAPAGLDLARLPPIEGAGPPSLALAGRAPVGEALRLDARELPAGALFLALAAGEAPWGLPSGGRWDAPAPALENLSLSRTLALGSPDLVAAAMATARVEMGEGNASRTLVAIGGVTGGPTGTLWTCAAFVAGAGQPVSARLVVPLEPGADREAVAARALEAWSPFGVVLDR